GDLDLVGAAATALAVAGFLGLLQAPTAGPLFGGVGLALLAVGVPLAMLRVRSPPEGFLPVPILRDREIMRASAAGLMLLSGYLAMLLVAPELLADARGWRPLQIGLALLPAAMIGAAGARLAGRLGPRIGQFRTARAAAVVALVGVAVAAVAPASTAAIVTGVAGGSVGFGASQAVLVDHISTATPPDLLGGALGVFNLIVL